MMFLQVHFADYIQSLLHQPKDTSSLQIKKYFVYPDCIDGRKSFNGLTGIVRSELQEHVGFAAYALNVFGQLYNIEREIKDKAPSDRKKARHQKISCMESR